MDYDPTHFQGHAAVTVQDRGQAVNYQFRPEVLLAIDMALATDRPLLVSGPPGCGKTSLAEAIAAGLDARYLSRTVTSRTQIDDLFAEVDTLRRLADAQARKVGEPLRPAWTYLRPGLLWWAFNATTAKDRGANDDDLMAIGQNEALVPGDLDAVRDALSPPNNPTRGNLTSNDVVVLLDEIDKADPDLPNDLLEPLDRRSFQLPLADRPPIKSEGVGRIVMVLTTNGEREMPAAFVRRCITLELEEPKAAKNSPEGAGVTLESIAHSHFPGVAPAFQDLITRIAEDVDNIRMQAEAEGVRAPSTAEYLDTLRALKDAPDLRDKEEIWEQVKALLLSKTTGVGGT